jgi:hypothetical protein
MRFESGFRSSNLATANWARREVSDGSGIPPPVEILGGGGTRTSIRKSDIVNYVLLLTKSLQVHIMANMNKAIVGVNDDLA